MKNPLITMSALTGNPTKNEIYEYLTELKENGIGGVLIYPRSGCEIEYLSDEWFRAVGDFISSAKELDMYIWLYDDFNWPSGDAGGRVTAKEPFRLKAIKTKGDDIGSITSKSRHNSGLFGEKFFPNLLSFEAVDYFISCTHEEYFKRFKAYFGTVIKGIYTDEPSIGYCCESDSLPYYEGIENDYFNLCSRDFYKDMAGGSEAFYFNAIELVSKRFNECYIGKLASWCQEHGIIMTGHLLCDNDPVGATKHSGHFLKSLSSFTLPGIDEIETDFSDVNEMTLFGACEYASKGRGAMAELFALGPCDMSYAKKRCMLYLAAAFKIDHYFLAVSHLDMRGNLKVTDYFNNFSADQPDFGGTRLLLKDAELASALAKKDYTPDVYIRYPFDRSIGALRENITLDSLKHLVNRLTYRGVQWKFIDDETPLDAHIIELNDKYELTMNGKALDTSAVFCDYTIKDANGKMADGIFARRYNDGSMLIINLFAHEGVYKVDGKNYYLDTFSVVTCNDSTVKTKREINLRFDVKYGNDNIARTMHVNGQKNVKIQCNCDTGATFFVRKGVNMSLNGEALPCKNEALPLSRGLRGLYTMSDKIHLESGESIISADKDFKYMPSVLVSGEFLCHTDSENGCTLSLYERKSTYKSGEELFSYGKIELTSKITVPCGANEIEIAGTDMYTQVYLDDVLLGECIASPYIFKLDKSLWNKEMTVRVVQYSSIAPIFGDVGYWDRVAEKFQWRGTPSTSSRSFGFKGMYWNFINREE